MLRCVNSRASAEVGNPPAKLSRPVAMAFSWPADAKEHVAAVLEGRDLTQTSLKVVRGLLEERWKLDAGALDPFKDKVKELTTAEIQRIQEAEAAAEEAAPAEATPPAKVEKRATPDRSGQPMDK